MRLIRWSRRPSWQPELLQRHNRRSPDWKKKSPDDIRQGFSF
jgi:hypothetical protein